eukprot:4780231-Amphidinium_carterae.1
MSVADDTDVQSSAAALKVSLPGGDYEGIVRQLLMFGVPETRSRTNLGTCRSQLFGLYTKRGVGVTNVTRKRQQVLQLIHALARTRADPTPYLSVAFNEMHDEGIQEHVDANNEGCSDLTVFGGFTGGLLCQLGEKIDVRHKWVRFFAQLPHSVTSTKGRRLSVSFFTPRLTHKVDDSLWLALHEEGFPVREYFMSKLPQVVSCLSKIEHTTQREVAHTPKKRDQESYCCTCGVLTPYECFMPG